MITRRELIASALALPALGKPDVDVLDTSPLAGDVVILAFQYRGVISADGLKRLQTTLNAWSDRIKANHDINVQWIVVEDGCKVYRVGDHMIWSMDDG